MMNCVKTTSGQKGISGKDIKSQVVLLPPVKEQAEIVRRVEQLFAYADTIEKQVNNALARVNNLTQSITAKAFRGELTAQWRAENPDLISGENSAAALLEKIKAERAASGGKKPHVKILNIIFWRTFPVRFYYFTPIITHINIFKSFQKLPILFYF